MVLGRDSSGVPAPGGADAVTGATSPVTPSRPAAAFDQAWAAYPPSIGHYAIEGIIGAGGFGTVYRGMHRWLRVPAAIKVIQCEPSDRLRKDFRREAQRQARLQAHPGIAQVRDFGFFTDPRTNSKLPYYVMDLIPGNQSLTEYAAHLDLSQNERLRLFVQVCDAVQYAHDRGILHLDLKPANILVFPEAEGRAAQTKVIDFGIARAADPALERRARVGISGTIAYMSPEQTEASVPLDARSDVYSLGVVLYELVCGQLPYEVSSRPAPEAYRVVREVGADFESPRPSRLPAPLKAILSRAMAKRAPDRYSSAGSLSDDIREYLRGGVPVASGGGMGAKAWAGVRGVIAYAPWLAAALIFAVSVLLTREVGVPLVNRWTQANVWFERWVVSPPIKEYQKTIVVGWSGPQPGTKPETPDAPSLTRSEYRGLLADMLTRLGQGVKPTAVVLDHTVRSLPGEDTSQADARLAAAAGALVRSGVPVLVAVRVPALAMAGAQPPEDELLGIMARAIGRWGHVKTHAKKGERCEVILLQWEPGNPEPAESLSLATVTAIRGGGQRPGYQLEEGTDVILATYYADPAKVGGRPRVPAGLPQRFETTTVRPHEPSPTHTDATMMVALPRQHIRDSATLSLMDVLNDDKARARCGNKVVVYGDLTARDSHPILDEVVPGVYAHATAIEMLLSETSLVMRMPAAWGEWLIPAMGAGLGLMLPLPFLRRRAWWPHWAVGGATILWSGVIIAAVVAAVVAAREFRYLFNPLVVIFAMVVAAALMVIAGLIRRSHPLTREVSP